MTQSWRPFLQTGKKTFQIKSFPLRNEVSGFLSAAVGLLPTPPSSGEMVVQTPMLPFLSLCPIANSR